MTPISFINSKVGKNDLKIFLQKIFKTLEFTLIYIN